jgi:OmpA-OmpF porin, OOP family
MKRYLLLCVCLPLFGQAPDIQPFPGAKLWGKKVIEFDNFEIPTGPVNRNKLTSAEHLQGKITSYEYTPPAGHSKLERYTNYEQAFREAGFQKTFSCHGAFGKGDCGDGGMSLQIGHYPSGADDYYWVGKMTKSGHITWGVLWVNTRTQLYFVEPKEMTTGQVKLTVGKLEGDLQSEGHASIYGINFDTGKADIKPDSDAVLATIAELLKKDASLKIYVIGHTDNVGQLAANMSLSGKRAQAVASALETKYGIAAARLHADGVGPLSPVATNRTEEGRTRNRRVELVEQ